MSVFETCTFTGVRPHPQKKDSEEIGGSSGAQISFETHKQHGADPTYGWSKEGGSWKKPTIAWDALLETPAGNPNGNFRKSSNHPFFRCEVFVLGSAIHLCGAWNCRQAIPRYPCLIYDNHLRIHFWLLYPRVTIESNQLISPQKTRRFIPWIQISIH